MWNGKAVKVLLVASVYGVSCGVWFGRYGLLCSGKARTLWRCMVVQFRRVPARLGTVRQGMVLSGAASQGS